MSPLFQDLGSLGIGGNLEFRICTSSDEDGCSNSENGNCGIRIVTQKSIYPISPSFSTYGISLMVSRASGTFIELIYKKADKY